MTTTRKPGNAALATDAMRRRLLIVIIALTALALPACAAPDAGSGNNPGNGNANGSDADSRSGGAFRRIWADPPTLDPHLVSDTLSAGIINEVFSGLVAVNTDLRIAPDLAESWAISDDGRTYTFTIRPNARFQDGRPVTAADFVYSLNRAASAELASPVAATYLGDIVGAMDAIQGDNPGVNPGSGPGISGVTAPDERTLRIAIDAPKSYFIAKLTYPAAFVIDPNDAASENDTALENNPASGPDWLRSPNATGPFRLDEYRPGQQLTLTRNEHYRPQPPHLDRVEMNLAGAAADALALYQAGQIDLADVDPADLERLQRPDEPLSQELHFGPPGFRVEYIGMNVHEPPFDDADFRHAMNLAVDKTAIIAEAFGGRRAPAYGVLPPGFPAHNPDLTGLRYDPERARQLLAGSRYADPDGRPPIALTVRADDPGAAPAEYQQLAELWRQNLGVSVELRPLEWNAYVDALYRQRFQSFALGWTADYPDPQNFLDVLFHSGSDANFTGYANPEVDALLEKARTAPDFAERTALYQEAERRIVNDAPWVPLWFGRKREISGEQAILLKPYVQGYTLTPMLLPKLRYVHFSR